MTTPLRLLAIEDNQDDLDLSLRELRRGGFEVSWNRVETRSDMKAALAEATWDLILCDHIMPQFNSAMALDVLRTQNKDIPFIVVSGVAPEDIVTAAMRAGAHDFISKGSLVRLVPAVQRELREANLRRDRNQIATRLAESEQRYASFFNETPLPMLVVDASTLLVVDANPAAALFFGHSLLSLKQASIHALSHTHSGEWKRARKAKDRPSHLFSDQVLLLDGQVREVDVYAVKIHQGGRSLLLATLFDQTDRRIAERSLAESEKRFRSLADSSPMLIWTAGPDGKCDYFNQPWLDFRDRPLEEEMGDRWIEGIHPEDQDRVISIHQEAFAKRMPFEMEFRLLRCDGMYRWILNKGVPRFTSDNEFIGCVGSCLDITDRRTAEESRAMLVAAVEQVAESIAITDPKGQIIYANKAFQALTGFMASMVKGWAVVDLLEREEIRGALQQAGQGVPWAGITSIRTVAGKNLEVATTCSPIRDRQDQVSSLVLAMRDVTKEAELERGLRQAQKMEALGSLAAGVAHDFNNILTTILTAAELVKRKLPQDSPIIQKVDVISQAGLCAAGLNKQILSFSRHSEETRLPFDLSGIARVALRMLRSTLPAVVEIRSEMMSGIWVEGDPVQFHQIFLNLSINAFQAMQPNGGVLSISLGETTAEARTPSLGLKDGRYALLTVKDTGCGIDAQTLERIFDPFFTTKPQGEGTGLGLSVVHASVAKAGGKVTVTSEPGKGTEFRIYWPCAVGRALPVGERPPEDVSGSESFLFVDDDELVSALAKLGLQDLGYSVTTHNDPAHALEEFTAHPDNYDLVFTDLAMPGINGIDLANRIHEIRPATPILLVSGLPLASALSLDIRTRFEGVVAKPFAAFDLAEAARKALAQFEKADSKCHETSTHSLDREWSPRTERRILLVDDSQTTRSMVKTWLERVGCEVVEARDGREAWEIFSQGARQSQFSLVLTDVVMPRMDGLELTQLIRKSDTNIPIAILTSNEDKDTLKSALNLGVNEFLSKPFESEELVQCVENLLALRRSRLATRRSVETAQAVRLAQKTLVAVPEKDLPLFSLYEPLTDAGGDVFRCLKCADGSILFILADVAGHSVISSYAVASFLAMLSNYVGECRALMALTAAPGSWDSDSVSMLQCCGHYGKIPCDPLHHLILKLNQAIQSGPFSEVPICLLLGQWAPATGQLKLLNAGIPHGLLWRQDTQLVVPLNLNGTPLGIFPEPMVEEGTYQLGPGDRLLFGTDGFFDILSRGREPFEVVAPSRWDTLRGYPIDWALSMICEEARNHGGGVIADDLLVVGFEQAEVTQTIGELSLRIPSNPRAIDMACERLTEHIRATFSDTELQKGRLFDILLAVREAVVNAMIHGNKNRPEAFVVLHFCQKAEQEALVVAVTDEGVGFDLSSHAPPGDPLSERGRGIPLIRAHAHEVQMAGSQLTMTFQLKEMAHDGC